MRTVKTKVYKFSELSKAAKQKAIEEFWDINVDYDWWDMFEDECAEYGILIKSFDLDRGQSIDMEIDDPKHTAEKIIENHGDTCDTYIKAKKFLEAIHVKQVAMALLGIDPETDDDNCKLLDEIEDLTDEFKEQMERCYWKMLYEEYQWRLSEEAVRETIECNDYEFTKDGQHYHEPTLKDIINMKINAA